MCSPDIPETKIPEPLKPPGESAQLPFVTPESFQIGRKRRLAGLPRVEKTIPHLSERFADPAVAKRVDPEGVLNLQLDDLIAKYDEAHPKPLSPLAYGRYETGLKVHREYNAARNAYIEGERARLRKEMSLDPVNTGKTGT